MVDKISPSGSFKGFDLKTFLLGFKKPAIVLITFGLGYIIANPTGAEAIAFLGGVSVVVERIWALCEFYIKKIKLN